MPFAGLKTTTGECLTREEIAKLDYAIVEELFNAPYPLVIARLGPERTPYRDDQVALTSLCTDMQQTVLKRRYDWYETIDEGLWALMGTGLHVVLEEADPTRAEQSVVATIDGIEVRSRRDHYTPDGRILDWKLTSMWTGLDMMKAKDNWPNVKPDYGDQIGFSAALECRQKTCDMAPTGGAIVLVYRDWTPGQAAKFRNLPQVKRQTFVYPEAKWDIKAFDEALVRRVRSFEDLLANATDSCLPPCADTWRPDKKTGLPGRCLNYCPVSQHCSQFAAVKQQAGARRSA